MRNAARMATAAEDPELEGEEVESGEDEAASVSYPLTVPYCGSKLQTVPVFFEIPMMTKQMFFLLLSLLFNPYGSMIACIQSAHFLLR